MEALIILAMKVLFYCLLFILAFSLATWKLKDRPSYIRKPLVLLTYPITCLPRLLLSLINGEAYIKQYWIDKKNNFIIAWNGCKQNENN